MKFNLREFNKEPQRTFMNVGSFNYKKGDVTLAFNLNLDKKQDLKDYQDLLKMALYDLEAILTEQSEPQNAAMPQS